MVYAYNNSDQTLTANQLLTFTNNGVISGACTSHAAGSSAVYLNRTGYYQVSVNADAVEGGTAGNITLQLYANGEPVPGAEATVYSGATTDIMNLSFNALIKALPNCCAVEDNLPVALTVVNTGVGAVVSNSSITVVKVA